MIVGSLDGQHLGIAPCLKEMQTVRQAEVEGFAAALEAFDLPGNLDFPIARSQNRRELATFHRVGRGLVPPARLPIGFVAPLAIEVGELAFDYQTIAKDPGRDDEDDQRG